MACSFAPADGQSRVVLLQGAYVAGNLYQRRLALEPFRPLFQDGCARAVRFDERDGPCHCGRWLFRRGPTFETATDALALEQPGHPEAVCPYMTMKRARALRAVEVDPVAVGDDAQPAEVEMSVAALERVESPGDAFKASGERLRALGKLEPVAEGSVAESGLARQHVRMDNAVRALLSDEAVNESGHHFAVECSDEDATDLSGRDEVRQRNYIFVAPHFPLEFFDGAHLRQRLYISNDDRALRGFGGSHAHPRHARGQQIFQTRSAARPSKIIVLVFE